MSTRSLTLRKTKRSLAPKKRNPPAATRKTKAGTKRRKRKAKSESEDEISSLTESSLSDLDNVYYLKQESLKEEKENHQEIQTPPQYTQKTPMTPTSAIPTPSQSRPVSVAPSPAQSFQSFSWMSPTRSVHSPLALSRHGTPSSSLNFSPLKVSGSLIPFDPQFVKQVGRGVVLGQQFDVSIDSVDAFNRLEAWYGRVWCCVPDARPVSTSRLVLEHPQIGLERILQTVFTKFANKEFAEGLFVIRGELGADWCTVSFFCDLTV